MPRTLCWVAVTLCFFLVAPVVAAEDVCESIDGLAEHIAPGRIFLLGELHGTEQSPAFAASVACAVAVRGNEVVVGLELASGAQEFHEPAKAGDTVRDVLKGLSARFPKLDNALWDENARNEIGTHIEVIVNDTIMGNDYTLESPVKPGYQIILTGQYIGG